MAQDTAVAPSIAAGTWKVDRAHSEVGFTVRHMMVSRVRGTFRDYDATITIADDPLQSSVAATIDLSSIDTGDGQRDSHLRSADFFDVETHPKMTYRSTAVEATDDGFLVRGELSLHGVTQEVPLELGFAGTTQDPWGGTRAGFSATTEINRKDFGIELSMPLDGGGVVVGDKIKVNIEIEAVLQTEEA
jgi:polyisoprenoid-binding protein YceI